MAERNLRVLDKEVAIGCALLCRTDRLEMLDRASGGSNTLVGTCVCGRPSTPLATMGPTAVFAVHLDATSEQKRIDQVLKCLSLAREMEVREVVFAGDMNSEFLTGSCVTALLHDTSKPSEEEMARQCALSLRLSNAEGGDEEDDQKAAKAVSEEVQAPTAEQMKEWRELWDKARQAVQTHRIALSRVATGPTRAGYDHGEDCGPCLAWSLDHVLYTNRTLALSRSWESLEGDANARETGLPNRDCPSDHLPVAAAFKPTPTPKLSSSNEASLLQALEALEKKHGHERDALTAKLEAQKPVVAAESTAEGGQTAKEKKRKKTEKPPPEVIAHIQESRKQQRVQKEEQSKERASFVGKLGELELDSFEKVLTPATWIESGAR